MMEVVTTKDSHYGLRVAGRWVCSSVSPLKEAQDWVTRHQRQLRSMKVVFVLGLGCGYHVIELKKKYPHIRVLVCESNSDIMERTLNQHPLDIERADLVMGRTPADILSDKLTSTHLAQAYTVLKFAPAMQADPSFFSGVEELLCGRTEAGLNALISARPDMAKQLNLDHLRVVEQELISIKTIERASHGLVTNRWLHICRALREIVN